MSIVPIIAVYFTAIAGCSGLNEHPHRQVLREVRHHRRSGVHVIKHLFSHAMPMMRKDNPFDAIDGAKVAAMPKGNDGHHSWTEAQVSTYRAFWPPGTKQRLVMEFAYEAVSWRGAAAITIVYRLDGER